MSPFLFLPTFSLLAFLNSKTHRMMGFVTMEIVILRILPIPWQVLAYLALLPSFIILSLSALSLHLCLCIFCLMLPPLLPNIIYIHNVKLVLTIVLLLISRNF